MNKLNIPLGMLSETTINADMAKYKPKYYIYVEGRTDKTFYSKVIRVSDVICKSVEEATRSDLAFRDRNSNKKTIIFNFGFNSSASPPSYGIVDRDYENKQSSFGVFYTDTRDLESMLIYTDKNLYQKLGCLLGYDDIKKALFMAYQWGYMKQQFSLFHYENLGDVLLGIEKCFNESCQINIVQMREHIKQVSSACPSSGDIKRFAKNDKNITDNRWNQNFDVIDFETDLSVWAFINGHDFIYFLKATNESVNKKYGSQNYSLEYAIIENYDIDCFKSTRLYQFMMNANLVPV